MYEEENNAPENQAPEEAGRSTDTVLGHLSLGEIVIPRAMQDDPQISEFLKQAFEQAGLNIAEFTVGDEANKINPETGYPEFFKIGKILKTVAPAALAYFGAPYLTPLLGATGAGAALGGIGGLATGGGLQGALSGAVSGGIGANLSGIGNALGGFAEDLGFGTAGNALQGAGTLAQGGKPIQTAGTGLAGALSGNAVQALPSAAASAGGGAGGGSTFNYGSSIASALGGINQQDAIKKAQKQLLTSNQQQQANLGTFDPSNITNDAGYQFNLAEGQKGLDRSLAAQGGLQSGAALKAAAQYNQDYAGNALNSAYNRWANQTGAQNQLYANQGNINSQATTAAANGLSSTLSGILNPSNGLSQQDLIKLLTKQSSGSLYG